MTVNLKWETFGLSVKLRCQSCSLTDSRADHPLIGKLAVWSLAARVCVPSILGQDTDHKLLADGSIKVCVWMLDRKQLSIEKYRKALYNNQVIYHLHLLLLVWLENSQKILQLIQMLQWEYRQGLEREQFSSILASLHFLCDKFHVILKTSV